MRKYLLLLIISLSILYAILTTPQPIQQDHLYERSIMYFVYAEDQPAAAILLDQLNFQPITNNYPNTTIEFAPINDKTPYQLRFKIKTPNKKDLNEIFNQTNQTILKQAKQLAYNTHIENVEISLMEYR